jgi:UDP-N-acetylmuramoyl-tripeptide--D-alanyl-D-alanine ligase
MQQHFPIFYECSGISTDTRTISPGDLFICLKGDRYDANEFAEQALSQGAKYVISSDPSRCNSVNILYVDDTLDFLQALANHHRKQFNIPVLGITGSNGKTTTKELINAVLETERKVLCTKGNLNNHIGVPLTLLRLNATHEIAIIEMGANKPGDIEELCNIAEPTHGIITNIGSAHLEGFGTFEGVLNTKLALYRAIESQGGTLFFNADDPVLTQHLPAIRSINYGMNSASHCQGTLTELTPYVNFQYTIDQVVSPVIKTHLIGAYNLSNFLAAICIGNFFQLTPTSIQHGLENYIPSNNRSQIHKTERNTLILDCYNANPSSMRAALESFEQIKNEQKLAILGDMLELGGVSEDEHAKIIALCNTLSIPFLTVGKEFGRINTEQDQFQDTQALISSGLLAQYAEAFILIKGSRGIGLEALIPLL